MTASEFVRLFDGRQLADAKFALQVQGRKPADKRFAEQIQGRTSAGTDFAKQLLDNRLPVVPLRETRRSQARRRGKPMRTSGRVRELTESIRRAVKAHRAIDSLNEPISLQEAIKRNPSAASPAFLDGEVWRQSQALREGGEPALQYYLRLRKEKVGF